MFEFLKRDWLKLVILVIVMKKLLMIMHIL